MPHKSLQNTSTVCSSITLYGKGVVENVGHSAKTAAKKRVAHVRTFIDAEGIAAPLDKKR